MKRHHRDPDKIQHAKSLVTQFFSKRKPDAKNAWKDMKDANIQGPLNNRIDNPRQIYQALTNTCGPASFVYALAYYRPDLYAQIVLDMYAKGETTLGSITLEPDNRTRQSWASNSASIAAVDWLAIASVKNSTSSSYNSPDDVLSGITMPDEMAGWLRKTGWTIQSQAASITRQDVAKLQAASQAYTASKAVFLFVKAKAIDQAAKTPWWGVDHWIVLASSK